MTDARVVVMPVMSTRQAASWQGLMELYRHVPTGWTLVGGQLVHLHCAERDHHPDRPTDDVDAVIDVRAAPDMLERFTRALTDLGFMPETSGDGLQHRWRRGDAQIDVLLPEGIGERSSSRPGAGGAPSLPTPGGTQALRRTEAVTVDVDGAIGAVLRPTLVGALVMKAAAHAAIGDSARGRHRLDFVTLAGLLDRRDFATTDIGKTDRQRLRHMVQACRKDAIAMEPDHAQDSLARLETAAALG